MTNGQPDIIGAGVGIWNSSFVIRHAARRGGPFQMLK
jgi:hypothetical protein